MCQHAHLTLAQVDRGWRVYRLGDGALQLDLGLCALVMTWDELLALYEMIELARCQNVAGYRDVTGREHPFRRIAFCSRHNAYTLIFDRVMLRFRRHELETLANLCSQALYRLQEVAHQGQGRTPVGALHYALN